MKRHRYRISMPIKYCFVVGIVVFLLTFAVPNTVSTLQFFETPKAACGIAVYKGDVQLAIYELTSWRALTGCGMALERPEIETNPFAQDLASQFPCRFGRFAIYGKLTEGAQVVVVLPLTVLTSTIAITLSMMTLWIGHFFKVSCRPRGFFVKAEMDRLKGG